MLTLDCTEAGQPWGKNAPRQLVPFESSIVPIQRKTIALPPVRKRGDVAISEYTVKGNAPQKCTNVSPRFCGVAQRFIEGEMHLYCVLGFANVHGFW